MRSAFIRIFAIVAIAGLVLAACGDDNNDNATPATTPPTTAGTTTTAGSAAGGGSETVALAANSTIGKDILVDGEGRALYVFNADTAADKSSCTGGCAQAWPPVVVTGTASYGDGVEADDFTTFTRDDGSKQVAYYGHPLYRFAGDEKAGQANGQGSGGSWYVVGANGKKIDDDEGDDDTSGSGGGSSTGYNGGS
jgi:predicted lipoprotein with Yx(FWY)xxD motif